MALRHALGPGGSMARAECARAVIGIVTALMVLASDGRLSVAASGDGEATLPVPRFVTLHADRVNLRNRPRATATRSSGC